MVHSLTMEFYPTVEDFYKDGVIFLTGGTGFMGKVLLDTLLRRFPSIHSIYILVRERKGVSPQERIEKMLDNELFEKMRKEVPEFKSKIKVLQGNIEQNNLGLSSDDFVQLTSNINIIFHCAATLRFDEELKIAIRTNICATQTVVKLAKQCPHLRLFMYVSTAFSNAYLKTIDEKIYSPPSHYSYLISLTQLGDDEKHTYESAVKSLFEENINTYTMTKAAAEQMIHEEAKDIPAAIFRPSIVISTNNEPIPGYIDNFYGPTGLVSGVMAGIIRSIYCNPSATADVIPADMAINALVCSAWYSANSYYKKTSPVLPIFNYVSSTDNRITWLEFSNKTFGAATKIPSSKALWWYCYHLVEDKTVYAIQSLFYHYFFAYIVDFCAPLTKSKLRLVPIYQRIDKVMDVLEPFSTNEWSFINENIHTLWDSLSPQEQAKFPFNIRDLDWTKYLETYVKGILVYQLQDKLDPETRKYARRRYKRIQVAHYSIQAFLCLLLLFLFVWTITSSTFL
ncbi:hypothetical protein M8J75_006156 [Diaphorina citri]|nr:hypothetical protein M8J75_006156 [Diaphorina citri]